MPTTAGSCCPACRSSSRRRIRCTSCRRRRSPAASPEHIPLAVQHRAAVSVLRLQHAVQRVRQHHEAEGRAHDEDGALRRAHDAARRADVELQRQLQLQRRRRRTRATPTSGFANALLGAITEYTESDGHPSAHGQFLITEWYAQDNWRVNRNLTLDAGVRFYYMTPTQSEGDQVAAFEPGEWNSAQAPRLYQPVSTPDGRPRAQPADR